MEDMLVLSHSIFHLNMKHFACCSMSHFESSSASEQGNENNEFPPFVVSLRHNSPKYVSYEVT